MIFIVVIIIFLTLYYAVFPTAYFRLTPIGFKRFKSKGKELALTFDDGPDKKYTPELLTLLKENHVHATFFIVTEQAQNNPLLINRMKNEGHSICLHSLEHKLPIIENPYYAKQSLEKSLAYMHSLGIKAKYFRPSWGCINLITYKYARQNNLNLVFWSVMAGDWSKKVTPELISKRLEKRVKSGSIICLHDGRGKNQAPKKTITALKYMLPIWKNSGYEFKRIEEIYERHHQEKKID